MKRKKERNEVRGARCEVRGLCEGQMKGQRARSCGDGMMMNNGVDVDNFGGQKG